MKMKFKELSKTLENEWLITLTTKENIIELYNELKDKELSVEIKQFRQKRSLNANNYFWLWCGELASALNNSPIEIYKGYIKEIGVFRQVTIDEKAVDTLIHSWGLNGIGWLAEKVDYAEIEGFVLVNLYYGSSTFNTRQMSRLIDYVVADCKEQGIETMSERELSLIKEKWGADN